MKERMETEKTLAGSRWQSAIRKIIILLRAERAWTNRYSVRARAKTNFAARFIVVWTLVVLWLLVGAATFTFLESSTENTIGVEYCEAYEAVHNSAEKISWQSNESSTFTTVRRLMNELTHNSICTQPTCIMNGSGVYVYASTDKEWAGSAKWRFPGAFFYSFVTITSIGTKVITADNIINLQNRVWGGGGSKTSSKMFRFARQLVRA
jgi:hypothetical protein